MQNIEGLKIHDEQVIGQILAGQTQAYGYLVQRYWKLALAIAYSRCQDSTVAEDIAQNSFIKAYVNLSTLRNRTQFVGWLTKIIHQQCITHHRRQKNTVLIDAKNIDHIRATFAVSSNPGLTVEQVNCVHHAIRKLPVDLQNIVIMRFVGGLSLRQIAEQIGKKYGTVRVQLHRAYKTLKEELAPLLQEVQP